VSDTVERDLVERLYTAIRRLPLAEASRVLLHLDGLTYRQMAEVLGVPEGNVGVKLHRAKRMSPDPLQETWQSQHQPAIDTDKLVREFR
jgi:RNA polymerase sigma-70 factor (ECF subfamily)